MGAYWECTGMLKGSFTPLPVCCVCLVTHNEKVRIPGLDHTHFCSRCRYGCDSEQKLTLHAFSAHRVKDPTRCYINTTFCTICLKEFHKRENVLNHVRRGRTPCKQQLLLAGPCLSVEEADAIDLCLRELNRSLQKKGLRRHALVAPCIRVFGPKVAMIWGPVQPVL